MAERVTFRCFFFFSNLILQVAVTTWWRGRIRTMISLKGRNVCLLDEEDGGEGAAEINCENCSAKFISHGLMVNTKPVRSEK